jgi:hypothetical protein
MDTAQILADLRAQRNRIENAITALEALNETKHLGNEHDLPAPSAKPAAALHVKQASQTVRRTMSPAARKKIATAQKARWAAKKKPTKSVAAARDAAPKKVADKTPKRVVSPESRKRMAEAQQKRWANRNKAAKAAAKKSAIAPIVKTAAKEPAKA